MAEVISINISDKKGTVKHPVDSVEVTERYGITGDAHSGEWHRQISLLDAESIDEYNKNGHAVNYGDFAENITTSGLDFSEIKIGDIIKIGECIIEITQIGKECHSACEIRKKTGDCIMPKRGLFAKVIQGGSINKGDEVEVMELMRAGVLTLSDKGSKGEREDLSGETIKKIIRRINAQTVKYEILPDEEELIRGKLTEWCMPGQNIDVIFTTGGTGFSRRDVTPEATKSILDREIPGFSETMRSQGYKNNPRAILSRGVSGIKNNTVIINLPGSVKAVKESLEAILSVLPHAVAILKGEASECGNKH